MKVVLGSDHAGFRIKELAKELLASLGYQCEDVGTFSEESVDYPDYAAEAASRVSKGLCQIGMLFCGSGIGMSIVANKFPGVRAALCYDLETARLSRRHNDANILILAGRAIDQQRAREIIKAWLATEFEGGRHQRRLDKIKQLEQNLSEA